MIGLDVIHYIFLECLHLHSNNQQMPINCPIKAKDCIARRCPSPFPFHRASYAGGGLSVGRNDAEKRCLALGTSILGVPERRLCWQLKDSFDTSDVHEREVIDCLTRDTLMVGDLEALSFGFDLLQYDLRDMKLENSHSN